MAFIITFLNFMLVVVVVTVCMVSVYSYFVLNDKTCVELYFLFCLNMNNIKYINITCKG